MKIYGGYIVAKNCQLAKTETMACVFRANNIDEVRGRALRFAKEQFLLEDGFTDHQAGVAEVPTEWYQEI